MWLCLCAWSCNVAACASEFDGHCVSETLIYLSMKVRICIYSVCVCRNTLLNWQFSPPMLWEINEFMKQNFRSQRFFYTAKAVGLCGAMVLSFLGKLIYKRSHPVAVEIIFFLTARDLNVNSSTIYSKTAQIFISLEELLAKLTRICKREFPWM